MRAAMSPAAAPLVAALLAAVALSGCGGNAADADRIGGRALTIYMSVPLQGASRVNARAVVSGAQLALAAIGGRIGRYRVTLRPLDDSISIRGWDPGQTTRNARTAVQDRTAIGYLGDFNSGASAISIPLLNRAGIAQISPASTAVGLTLGGPAAGPGEPQKYYPTGTRTFARVIPNDSVQAGAQAQLQRSVGCTTTYVADDGEFDGLDTATSFELAARAAGLQVVGAQAFDPKATDYTSFAAGVARSDAQCVLVSALTERGAVPVTERLAAALPHAHIFGAAGVGESTFADPARGGIPAAIDPRVLLTVATLGPRAYPPAGRAFLADYARRQGSPEPGAIFGYEAMSLMLDAIGRATAAGRVDARRSRVVAAIFATRRRHSVLGTYSIDQNGDTTLARYGVYRILAGRLVFWRATGARGG
jgi:branched-chain amino acid transport system substrate-binding protein